MQLARKSLGSSVGDIQTTVAKNTSRWYDHFSIHYACKTHLGGGGGEGGGKGK